MDKTIISSEGKYLNPISRDWIYKQFRNVIRKSGISHQGRRKGPRAYDLRHSFYVHSLKNMADTGRDIYFSKYLPGIAGLGFNTIMSYLECYENTFGYAK